MIGVGLVDGGRDARKAMNLPRHRQHVDVAQAHTDHPQPTTPDERST